MSDDPVQRILNEAFDATGQTQLAFIDSCRAFINAISWRDDASWLG
jgi:hypothetical protein